MSAKKTKKPGTAVAKKAPQKRKPEAAKGQRTGKAKTPQEEQAAELETSPEPSMVAETESAATEGAEASTETGTEPPAGDAADVLPEAALPPTDAPTAAAKPTRKKREAKGPKADGALSAIDAAAKVLGEAGTSMNAKQMIEAMAQKGYWTSPGGKTPAATLYSALLREIATKGDRSRFVKTERGQFALKA